MIGNTCGRREAIAQAATPTIGALLIQGMGPDGMLGAVTLLSVLNVALVGAVFLQVGAAHRQAVGLPIA